MEPKSSNSFSTFLETLQRSDAALPQTMVPLELLKALASKGPEPVLELMASSGLDLTEFTRVLAGMQDAGLVHLEGSGIQQVVALTDTGTKLASL